MRRLSIPLLRIYNVGQERQGTAMTKNIFVAIAFISLMTGGTVRAQPALSGQLTGSDWKWFCDKDDPANAASCIVYLLGALDGLRAAKGRGQSNLVVCEPPKSVTYLQWINIIREYLNGHPGQLRQPAPLLVQTIVNSAFPCS